MAVPANKAELLAAIDKTYTKLRAELGAIPEGRVLEKQMEGHAQGTMMSVHDLVAYLVGWNELVIKWCEGRRAGRPVDFPETGYQWNQLGALAQKFYADYADFPYTDLLERLGRAKSAIVSAIESESDAALYGLPWYNQWTMGRMIQFNTSSPYANASNRLRKWRKLLQ